MAKILVENVWWVFDCTNCTSKVEAEPEDVVFRYFDRDAYSSGKKRLCVECPKCGEFHKVPEVKITSKLYDIAREKKLV